MLSGNSAGMPDEGRTLSALAEGYSGDSSAIEDESGAILSYGDLRSLGEKTRDFLAGLGIGPHDTVAFVLENSASTAALFVALTTHCRIAPINPKLKAAEILFLLRDVAAAAVITMPRFAGAVSAA